ncbi:MAG: hypothetical protein HN522_00840 [Flavobacteriales bacterium]|jgi:hypothetical protein|nr:hypothetical protein [Flavobacteriales bacterium]MBT5089646.1 hypothetical protein [Flavobacteriales bacterium]MBT5749967.1 hypothetical protein [Flavobacteriales bacterium]
MKKIIFFFFFLNQVAQAQVTVSTIVLSGNAKTQSDIIIRELSFEKNMSYATDDLEKKIEESKENLVNLKLFNFVTINKTENKYSTQTEITIEVIEKWYIWPYPVFEISERNFNTWWKEFAGNNYSDFSRLNYGAFFNWENFRGRNELLKLKIRKGFKEHYLLAYEVPYFNKNKTIGINTNLQFFRRKKTHYANYNNSLQYFESDNFNSIDYDLNTEIVYRNNIHQKHKIKFTYLKSTVSDSISILNPNYLGGGNTTADLFNISYQLEHEKRDYIIYPLHGYALSLEIKKYFSSDMHHFELLTKSENHIEPFNRFYIGSSFKTKYSSKGNQSYFIQKALGYEDYVRGYEYYVVDGQSYWLSKTAIKYALIKKTNFDIPYVKMKQFNKSHYSLYLGIFSDLGYVRNSQNQGENSLNNSLLWSKGIALDYVTYYDKLLRIEYSINALGEKGVFLHFSNPF